MQGCSRSVMILMTEKTRTVTLRCVEPQVNLKIRDQNRTVQKRKCPVHVKIGNCQKQLYL